MKQQPSVCGIIVLTGLLMPFGGTAHRKTEEGNRRYLEKDYEDALRAYTEGQVAAPEAPELHYDIGNVLYRQGDFQGAAEAFTRALLSAPASLAPRAAYNLGNALFRQKQFEDAVGAYRKTLEQDPADADAKRNLELALRALREQQQQQQQQQKQDENDKPGDARKPPSPQGEPEKSEQDEREQKQGGEKRQASLSPEEAQHLLDSLAEQERENLKRQAMRRVQERAGTEEDW